MMELNNVILGRRTERGKEIEKELGSSTHFITAGNIKLFKEVLNEYRSF
jgi:hypothetical protein